MTIHHIHALHWYCVIQWLWFHVNRISYQGVRHFNKQLYQQHQQHQHKNTTYDYEYVLWSVSHLCPHKTMKWIFGTLTWKIDSSQISLDFCREKLYMMCLYWCCLSSKKKKKTQNTIDQIWATVAMKAWTKKIEQKKKKRRKTG